MKVKLLIPMLCLMVVAAFAAKHADFSGSWQFNPEKSKNIGMMSQMRMTQTIDQSDSSLEVTTRTTFQGRDEDSKIRFYLAGKPTTHESPMGRATETVSTVPGVTRLTTSTTHAP